MAGDVEVGTWVALVAPTELYKLQIHDCTQQVSESLRTWARVEQHFERCSCSLALRGCLVPTKVVALVGLVMVAAAARSLDLGNGLAHTQPALSGAVLGAVRFVVVRLQWRHTHLAHLELAQHEGCNTLGEDLKALDA